MNNDSLKLVEDVIGNVGSNKFAKV